jgi:hypothetical protein
VDEELEEEEEEEVEEEEEEEELEGEEDEGGDLMISACFSCFTRAFKESLSCPNSSEREATVGLEVRCWDWSFCSASAFFLDLDLPILRAKEAKRFQQEKRPGSKEESERLNERQEKRKTGEKEGREKGEERLGT